MNSHCTSAFTLAAAYLYSRTASHGIAGFMFTAENSSGKRACTGSAGSPPGRRLSSRWTPRDYALLSKEVAAFGMGLLMSIVTDSFGTEARTPAFAAATLPIDRCCLPQRLDET